MGILKEFRTRAESISLPVEKALWQQILGKKEARDVLYQQPSILILGTNPEASLINEVLKSHPEATIIVIEKSPTVIAAAQASLSPEANVTFINQNVFDISREEIKDNPRLAIAKHLIHFCDASDLVLKTADLLSEGGLFYASTPIGFGWKTNYGVKKDQSKLEKQGIRLTTKEPLQGKSKGSLFCFSIGVPSRIISLVRSKRLAIKPSLV